MQSEQAEKPDFVALVTRLRDGEAEAAEQLTAAVYAQLVRLSRKMLRNSSAVVQRWEQTEDLAHAAWFRVQRTLSDPELEIKDEVHFFRLVARHIRFELIDLYRKHSGAQGLAANHHTSAGLRTEGGSREANDGERFAANLTGDPKRLAAWGEFHRLVEGLPDEERVIVDLLWYQGLKQADVAELLDVDVKTVKRRWRSIKIRLAESLDGNLLD